MTLSPPDIPPALVQKGPQYKLHMWAVLLLLVYAMLAAVSIIGSGFKVATSEHAAALFEFASNPVMGVIIGMVSTALLQSSSTVTSIIVAMVAGGLPIPIAIPLVMGANIGTSITSTFVSLGHMANKEEFKRAFNAATIHDFFNLLAVVIFLPLEIAFGLLEWLSGAIVSLLHTEQSLAVDAFNPIKAVTDPIDHGLSALLAFLPETYAGIIKIMVGVGLIMISITYMGKMMRLLMVGKARDILHRSIGKGPVSGIASGTLMTVLVQSSSTTTSLMVPLVGAGVLRAPDIYPFTLGANIGTCITALIAAFAVTGAMSGVALQIALVHFCYNFLAVLLIFGVPVLRNIPLRLSYNLANLVADQKIYGLAYIGGLFFAFPLSVVMVAA